MAKKQNKLVKEETLETILFNCRNSLRGRAAMTDKMGCKRNGTYKRFQSFRLWRRISCNM
ncbi:hypothetical protein [Phocaeicola sartorii]|jgi:hypothetical protein|uniref:hypothetical protein n=1 Tax=Phocaeicola sartorii TaxID=671267 RepID=UPI000A6C49F6|nr:hypothetical protein [Phocaeicola sartorii]NBH67966.1 hypothetical protein [Phocaeicola sartorii]